ncbi:fibronectin type III domain-containing protein [Natronobiforma cellulositropha]|uniref:fibronectin type III domain-containing protein n=1 Tax=Natronobiforma cellulositropha TaxID=1679076 RepID=UPI0021D5F27A|nr:fibronectin type III domain-containing protein [Natronobiforma cellulositropha]
MRETDTPSNGDEQPSTQPVVASRRDVLRTAATSALVASLGVAGVTTASAVEDGDDADDAGIVDYDLGTSRYAVGDPEGLPEILFGDDLEIRGTIWLPTTNCHTVELVDLEYDTERSHLTMTVADGLEDHVDDESDCSDTQVPIRYTLTVDFEDGLPETVTAIEDDAETTRQLTVASDGSALPPAPSSLEAVSVTDSAAELEWDGDADAYAVYVDGDLATEVDETAATVDGLESDATYEVAVTAVDGDGVESMPATTTVTTEEGEGAFELDVNGDGNPAQDLTGDGLYEDITGDGNLGFNDVVTFFEEHNGDTIQNNVEYFDFSGNGGVGFNDVVALFERL